MTLVIQHNKALGTTTFRANCDVNGNDNYFYASRRARMLEKGYISSLYAQFRLLIARDYAAETFYISNSKRKNEYVVILFKYVLHIILIFLGV